MVRVTAADPAPDGTAPADEGEAPTAVPLLEPRDGLPPVVDTAEALDRVVAALARGTGPVAVDAERASGYRYGQRAYLVQLRREGSGTALIDPIALPDLSAVQAVIGDEEWVLHAASQDLACLAEVGLVPARLFDTELAGRLLGHPRVGLGALVQTELGLALEKGHSAADWSTRPLPEPWLHYAALDVEVLVELRDVLAEQLRDQGKQEWARQEFAALLDAPGPPPRVDPWRRTSGVHRLRQRRQLATVRSLWEARDALARRMDVSPGRVLPDAAIVEAAAAQPPSAEALGALPGFSGRGQRRRIATWWKAVDAARQLPDAALPPPAPRADGPPPARAWRDRDPDAAARLDACRGALRDVADQHGLPVENLLSPDAVRRLAWQPPDPLDAGVVARFLTERGARVWQVELTAALLADALAAAIAASAASAATADASPADPAAEEPDGTGAADAAAQPAVQPAARSRRRRRPPRQV